MRHKGRKRAKCVRRGLTVKAAPAGATPAPAPAPAPAGPKPPAPDTRDASQKLRDSITADGMAEHLRAFQAIADDNGGNRASGFQGFGASVQYVKRVLSDAGYTPTTQVFDFVLFSELTPPVFERTATHEQTYVEGADEEFLTMSYSAAGDVTEPMTAVDVNLNPDPAQRTSTSGCEDADFTGFAAGDVALMQRGTCTFAEKVVNAQEAGASRPWCSTRATTRVASASSPARSARSLRTASPIRRT